MSQKLECARKSKCTWKLAGDESDPHFHNPLTPRAKIMDNVLECIGQTPLIRLQKLPQKYGLKCEVLVKCEYFNAGGSVKDRIGVRMIEEAERKGLIKPGYTLIEPTSGNTGIGIALAAAVKGYKCIIVMPEKMSNEKADLLKLLGAEIIRTPTEAASDSPESHIGVAKSLAESMESAYVLDQYQNIGNPIAHYDGTGEEILQQCDNRLDMFVGGVGTGGTISGIARKLKERVPQCKIVGVDPVGSILAHNEDEKIEEGFYEVEGIGYDFFPTVFDKNLIDQWVKTVDSDSFKIARELILEEGLLCGGSSGSAVWAALQAAKHLNENQRVVVVLPDGIRNYMSKFVSDEWMLQRNFHVKDDPHKEMPLLDTLTVASVLDHCSVKTIKQNSSINDAIRIMKEINLNQLPVLNDLEELIGVITMRNTMAAILSEKVQFQDPVTKCLTHNFPKMIDSERLSKLCKILNRSDFVLAIYRCQNREHVQGIITASDILNFLHSSQKI